VVERRMRDEEEREGKCKRGTDKDRKIERQRESDIYRGMVISYII